MIVFKFCLVLYLFVANILSVGAKRKKYPSIRFRCSDFLKYSNVLRREYALYMEDIPEALVYNFPEHFIKQNRSDWTEVSKFSKVWPCRNLTNNSLCQTRIDLDYNAKRYPSKIFITRCCGKQNFGTSSCKNGKAPKHVLIRTHLSRNHRLHRGRRRRWCTFKRDIQVISVRCQEEIHSKCRKSGTDPVPPVN